MSLPTEADFALVKRGDGATPEVFTTICGLVDVTINRSTQNSERYVRDCAKPGAVPTRKMKFTGKALDISATGLSNVADQDDIEAALGTISNYKIEMYQQDGTDAGVLLGTFAGAFGLTTANLGIPRDGVSSGDINLASDGSWTWTAA